MFLTKPIMTQEKKQFSEEHIGVLVTIKLCQLMEQLRSKTGNPLAVFVISILLILCLPNVSKTLYDETVEYQFYVKNKRSTGDCCLI